MRSELAKKIRQRLPLLAAVLVIALSPSLASSNTGNVRSATAENYATITPAVVTYDLWATTGSITMPDGTPVYIWGFSDSAAGPAQLPGPTLSATHGDTVNVILHNNLPENVSVIFPGQDVAPDVIGIGPGQVKTYSFTASYVGTYLFESGVNAQKQVQMGLYGALIVRPTTPGLAYGQPSTAFDKEAILVLSEIDPDLHAAVQSGLPYNVLTYNPRYWLINGNAYPNTSSIVAGAGQRVLFRYLNAGFQNHTLQLLGMYQRVIATDGNLLNYPYYTFSQTIVSGETYDLIATVPSSAISGSKFALFNRQQHITNVNSFPGGQLTFVTVP